jgi:hypothetical protein
LPAGADHEGVRLFLLEHAPLHLHLVAGVTPIAQGVEVAHEEAGVEALVDPRQAARNWRPSKASPRSGLLWVNSTPSQAKPPTAGSHRQSSAARLQGTSRAQAPPSALAISHTLQPFAAPNPSSAAASERERGSRLCDIRIANSLGSSYQNHVRPQLQQTGFRRPLVRSRFETGLRRPQAIGARAAALLLAAAPAVQAAQPLPARAPSANALQRTRVVYDAYILGTGDSLQVELLDIPELSGTFSIEPDGTMYLPRLRALYVEGLTVEELRYFLTQQFKAYVKNPQLYVRPVGYRPIRIYVGGEVRRPG